MVTSNFRTKANTPNFSLEKDLDLILKNKHIL